MNTQILSRERLGFLRSAMGATSPQTSSTSNQPQEVIPHPNASMSTSTGRLEDEPVYTEVEGKVKTRLLSMWNNMKYGEFQSYNQSLETSFLPTHRRMIA